MVLIIRISPIQRKICSRTLKIGNPNYCIKNLHTWELGAGELAQQLRRLVILPEDLGSIPSIQVMLTTT